MCCITYIDPSNKTVGLSNLKHLINSEVVNFSGLNVGDIIEDSEIVRIDEKNGVALKLKDRWPAYAHVSKLTNG